MRVLRDRKKEHSKAGGGQNPFLFAYFSLFIVKGVKRWHYTLSVLIQKCTISFGTTYLLFYSFLLFFPKVHGRTTFTKLFTEEI